MSKEYQECVYNLWTGFVGKATCEAGYRECDGFSCPMYTPKKEPKPQTNYDLLISKTPEELAKYLSQAWYDGPVFECPARASVGVDRCAEVKDCEDCFLDWLKAPVEVDK